MKSTDCKTEVKPDLVTDFARWQRNSQQQPSWDGRNQFIASLIAPGASVLDVGAGAMTLKQYLPRGTEYIPLDLVRSSERTILVNFNAYEIPRLDRVYDFVICSGVLEYIIPVHFFLNTVAGWGRAVILSYAITELNPTATTARTGWHNRMSDPELRALLDRHGLTIKKSLRWESQMIYVLDGTKTVYSLFHPAPKMTNRPDVASVFRYDRANVGDWFCAPMRYFDVGSRRCVDILDFKDTAPKLPTNLIIGGGGLLGSATFNDCFAKLLEQPHENLIGWGMGDNTRFDAQAGYVERGELIYPSFLKEFSLVGVRDFGTEYPWLPCASCLHPLFGEKWDIENEIVVFEHKRVPIPIHGFPKMNNDTNDLARVVRFLGTARVVITNSYHAAYWSQLLGKAVLAFPFSTKFYYFKHKVTLCPPADWKKYLDRVEEQPPALEDCRAANLSFWSQVKALLNLKPVETDEPETQTAAPAPVTLATPPARPRQNEVRIEAPLGQTEAKTLLAALGADEELVISDSNNPCFDHLKLQLFERAHIGCDPTTRRQTWRGAKAQRASCPPLESGADFPVIINFFTLDTPYEALAERLKKSCDQFGLPHAIEGIKSEGSWEFNCAVKARFILRKWQELQKPVLWLDADAIVRRPPTLLAGLDADFAIHKIDRWEFASGTVFLNQTPNALRLLQTWVRNCLAAPKVWDQQSLDAAWEEIAGKLPLETFWLPESYTRIFDRHISPGEDAEAVIEHFQASRDLKKVVSNQAPTPLRQYPPEFIKARSVSRQITPLNGHTRTAANGHAARPTTASPAKSSPVVPAAAAPVTREERDFIQQLSQFFDCKKLLLLDWENEQSVRMAPFHFDSVEVSPTRVETSPVHPQLPVPDELFQTVVNFASIARLGDAAVSTWLTEMHRVSGKNLWFVVEAANPRNYAWWEKQFADAGFRPHSRLPELQIETPQPDAQGALTFILEKTSAPPKKQILEPKATPAKTICLATNYLLMTPATRQMWADLGARLEECGCRLVLLSTTQPETPLPFPVHAHPYLMRDFASAFPQIAAAEGVSATPRELEWLQADMSRVPGGYPLPEALNGLAAFRAYFRELLRILQPGFVLIADNTLCQTALLQKHCLDVGIPVQVYERGLLPETLMIESRGIQAWSDLRTHWLAQDWPASVHEAAAFERIRAYYLARKPQKYAQADFGGGGVEVRQCLGLEGKKLVVFLGGGYEANGHAPKGGIYERHFYAGFPTTEQALMGLWRAVEKIPNTALVFKPHPLDPQSYAVAKIEGVQIVTDLNVHALIEAADVIAAQYTTLQFEAVLYDKPILALARSAWWGRNAAYEVESPEDLPAELNAALDREGWTEHQANARAFDTWLMEQFLIGCTAEVPARRNLRDFANFIARIATPATGIPPAAARCEQAQIVLEQLHATKS